MTQDGSQCNSAGWHIGGDEVSCYAEVDAMIGY